MNKQAVVLITLAPSPGMAMAVEVRLRRTGDPIAPSPDCRTRAASPIPNYTRNSPFLADVIGDQLLGDAWARGSIDHRTRQLAMVAAFAARGDRAQVKIHAGYALNVGVGQEELKEIVYMTAVQAGMAQAIDAAEALSELFAECWETGHPLV